MAEGEARGYALRLGSERDAFELGRAWDIVVIACREQGADRLLVNVCGDLEFHADIKALKRLIEEQLAAGKLVLYLTPGPGKQLRALLLSPVPLGEAKPWRGGLDVGSCRDSGGCRRRVARSLCSMPVNELLAMGLS